MPILFKKRREVTIAGLSDFAAISASIGASSIIGDDKLRVIHDYLVQIRERRLPGDAAEMGVYKGGTAKLGSGTVSTVLTVPILEYWIIGRQKQSLFLWYLRIFYAL